MSSSTPATSPAEPLQAIRDRIASLSRELATRSVSESPTLWEDSPYLEACKRCIIVAAVQHHTILFIGPEAPLAVMLADQAGVSSFATAAPSLNYSEGRDQSEKELRALFSKYDIHCEAPALSARDLASRGIRKGTPVTWVAECLSSDRCVLPTNRELSSSATTLLTQAIAELVYSSTAVRIIKDIAASIAALDHSPRIDLVHIAEAIQYRLDRQL